MFPNNLSILQLYIFFHISEYRRFLDIFIQQAVLSFLWQPSVWISQTLRPSYLSHL